MSWGVTRSDFVLLQDQTCSCSAEFLVSVCGTRRLPGATTTRVWVPGVWDVPLRLCVYIQMGCARHRLEADWKHPSVRLPASGQNGVKHAKKSLD